MNINEELHKIADELRKTAAESKPIVKVAQKEVNPGDVLKFLLFFGDRGNSL
jgi:uncharacterized protein YciU (UPF0263 family)